MKENASVNILPKHFMQAMERKLLESHAFNIWNNWERRILSFYPVEKFTFEFLRRGDKINVTFAGDRDMTQQVCANNGINAVFLRAHGKNAGFCECPFQKGWSSVTDTRPLRNIVKVPCLICFIPGVPSFCLVISILFKSQDACQMSIHNYPSLTSSFITYLFSCMLCWNSSIRCKIPKLSSFYLDIEV